MQSHDILHEERAREPVWGWRPANLNPSPPKMSRPSRPNRRGVGAELSFGPPIRSPQTTVFPFRCVALYLCVIVPFLIVFPLLKKKGTAHKGRALKNSSSHSPHSTDDRGRD